MSIKSIRFSIKSPNKTRRSFAVIRDEILSSGKRTQRPIDDPRIDGLNLNMRRGLFDQAGALAELKASIIPALKREAGIAEREKLEHKVSENNRKAYQAFWKETYEGGNLKNEASTRNDILGALRAIDPLSVTTATREDLRNKLNALPIQQQRRYCIRINQLLEFLGRGFSIEKKHREHADVDYVTWEELQTILPHIYSKEVQALAIALWGTGVRIGEAFSPGFARLKPNGTIHINRQMDLKLAIRDIKNGKPHHTILLPMAKDGYLAWCEVDHKARFRTSAINQIRMASKKAFPGKKEKQVSAHDLRHSFAIYFLGKGASLTQIAMLLGDSVATVQLHYTGFTLSDEAIEGVKILLK